jgi:hypothetical protein
MGIGQPQHGQGPAAHPPGGHQHDRQHGRLEHVGGERQGHHIGVEPSDQRPTLGAWAAIAAFEGDGLAGLLLPVVGSLGLGRLLRLHER